MTEIILANPMIEITLTIFLIILFTLISFIPQRSFEILGSYAVFSIGVFMLFADYTILTSMLIIILGISLIFKN